MRLASGIAPVMNYLAAGVKVGLGVDGSSSNDGSNMLGEVRQAMLMARLRMGLPPPVGPDTKVPTTDPSRDKEWMTARQALELGTLGGASLLGRDDIGSLAVGKRCDFFALDLNSLGFAGGLSDPVAATVFCAPAKCALHDRRRQARGVGGQGRHRRHAGDHPRAQHARSEAGAGRKLLRRPLLPFRPTRLLPGVGCNARRVP